MTRPAVLHLALSALLALLAGCEQAADTAVTEAPPPAAAAESDLAGAREAIDAVNAETGELIRAGKGASVAAQYTADAMLMPANAPTVGGTEAIATQFQAAVDAGVADLTLSASEVESRDDLAVEVGRFRATGADGTLLDEGKYIVVWRREGGDWKRHRDFFSSDLPPRALTPESLPATPAAE